MITTIFHHPSSPRFPAVPGLGLIRSEAPYTSLSLLNAPKTEVLLFLDDGPLETLIKGLALLLRQEIHTFPTFFPNLWKSSSAAPARSPVLHLACALLNGTLATCLPLTHLCCGLSLQLWSPLCPRQLSLDSRVLGEGSLSSPIH